MRTCGGSSATSGRRSFHATSRHRRLCAPSSGQKSKNGGRSSRLPTSNPTDERGMAAGGTTMDQDSLSKVEQFKLLTQTARDTPMGQLLRKFWHPIALTDELAAGKAKALRILSEDLTLYRGQS